MLVLRSWESISGCKANRIATLSGQRRIPSLPPRLSSGPIGSNSQQVRLAEHTLPTAATPATWCGSWRVPGSWQFASSQSEVSSGDSGTQVTDRRAVSGRIYPVRLVRKHQRWRALPPSSLHRQGREASEPLHPYATPGPIQRKSRHLPVMRPGHVRYGARPVASAGDQFHPLYVTKQEQAGRSRMTALPFPFAVCNVVPLGRTRRPASHHASTRSGRRFPSRTPRGRGLRSREWAAPCGNWSSARFRGR